MQFHSKIIKIPLLDGPTPLQLMTQFSDWIGVETWIKRDDLAGFALGGNKVRKFEYILADMKEKKSTVVIATGGLKSNNLRIAAAAARLQKIRTILVYYGSSPENREGNYLISTLLNCEHVFTNSSDRNSVDVVAAKISEKESANGFVPYVIPRGAATPVGCLGYVNFAFELQNQTESSGIKFDHVVVACGSGGTLAGIELGMRILGSNAKIWGIAVSRSRQETVERVKKLAVDASVLTGTDPSGFGSHLEIDDRFIGAGYGAYTPEVDSVITSVADLDSIFLDPVYTGKAMMGLLKLIEENKIKKHERVLFVHTGGFPNLFLPHLMPRPNGKVV